MRKNIVDMYQSGKGYKAISKVLELQRTTVRAIIHKWRKLHDSTTRKEMGKNGIHGRVPRQKPLLTKNNTKARLTFARNILIIPNTFVQIFCGLMRQRFNFLEGVCSVTSGAKPTLNFIKRTVKHGGGSVMVWGCFASSRPVWLAINDRTMNSAIYQKILKENVRPSVCDRKCFCSCSRKGWHNQLLDLGGNYFST